MLSFTPRVDGTDRATVKIAFHVTPATLVNAAMHVVAFQEVAPADLTKTAIEAELRMNLAASGDNFAEFGHEMVTDAASRQLDAIVARVAELYDVTF